MLRVGQRLKEQRLQKGLSLDEVSKAIKIRTPFLLAIEKGDYQKLPSSAYAQGFVNNYAQYLGLPKKEIMALFRREFDEEKIFKVLPEGFAKRDDFPIKRLQFGQLIALFFLFLLLGSYLIFQYRDAFLNPPLTVDTPKEGQIVESRMVVVSGTTSSNTIVYIGDASVPLTSDGSFKKTIDVFPGKTVLTIKAQNKFGKQTVKEIHIIIK